MVYFYIYILKESGGITSRLSLNGEKSKKKIENPPSASVLGYAWIFDVCAHWKFCGFPLAYRNLPTLGNPDDFLHLLCFVVAGDVGIGIPAEQMLPILRLQGQVPGGGEGQAAGLKGMFFFPTRRARKAKM